MFVLYLKLKTIIALNSYSSAIATILVDLSASY